ARVHRHVHPRLGPLPGQPARLRRDRPRPSPRQRRRSRPSRLRLKGTDMQLATPPIVSPDQWHAARAELREKEKEVMRARDALAAERRRMPWLAVEKQYRFDTA